MYFPLFTDIPSIIYVIYAVFTTFLIIMERKRPEKTLTWIIIFVLFPPIGILFYLLIGRNWKKKKNKLNTTTDEITKELFNIYNTKIEIKKYEPLTELFANNSFSPLYGNNEIELFSEGNSLFERIIEDIEKAKDHIHLEYYIFKNDDIGSKIIKALIKKANEGVEVRIIADKVGSVDLKRKAIKEMKKNNIDFVFYSYFLAPILKPFNTLINYRNHRKIIVIDGEIGYVGGFNIGDEYIKSKKLGIWKDTHIRVAGDFVYGLQASFLDDFNRIKKLYKEKNFIKGNYEKYFKIHEQTKDNIKMQLIKSGPDSENPSIMQGILQMINLAKKNINIVTPYFIPNDEVLSALKVAVLSGIDVKILFPSNIDHYLVRFASMTYLQEISETGAKIYFLNDKYFIHSKTISIDGEICSIGTANMDIRSYELNYEINAMIYDDKMTRILDEEFENNLLNSRAINYNYFENKNIFIIFLESFGRLFSNIL
ncbi:MAG: cardiolipin synthase [Oceanotoga sp.]|uniref:cardiolipin synthase n=1 Tax=Oceanotoga sp. TaxID=2108366 RepID=UPI00264FE5BE|nr:cardiolipin synthase [Oceanotoga sp.]MDN5341692.1 cardiolipin synthase [Oceanotoga sp.]